MADDVKDAIEENAQGPKSAKSDVGEVRQHSLKDQIQADRYLASRAPRRHPLRSLRFTKVSPTPHERAKADRPPLLRLPLFGGFPFSIAAPKRIQFPQLPRLGIPVPPEGPSVGLRILAPGRCTNDALPGHASSSGGRPVMLPFKQYTAVFLHCRPKGGALISPFKLQRRLQDPCRN